MKIYIEIEIEENDASMLVGILAAIIMAIGKESKGNELPEKDILITDTNCGFDYTVKIDNEL